MCGSAKSMVQGGVFGLIPSMLMGKPEQPKAPTPLAERKMAKAGQNMTKRGGRSSLMSGTNITGGQAAAPATQRKTLLGM